MKICLIFGHYDTRNSFNAVLRDTFIDEAEKQGHTVDLINLFDEEEQLPFYRADMNPPPQLVLDYRRRLEMADAMFLMGACHNLRMNVIIENWVRVPVRQRGATSYLKRRPIGAVGCAFSCRT